MQRLISKLVLHLKNTIICSLAPYQNYYPHYLSFFNLMYHNKFVFCRLNEMYVFACLIFQSLSSAWNNCLLRLNLLGLFFHCIWLSYQLRRKHLIIIITLFFQPRQQRVKKIEMMVVSVFWVSTVWWWHDARAFLN